MEKQKAELAESLAKQAREFEQREGQLAAENKTLQEKVKGADAALAKGADEVAKLKQEVQAKTAEGKTAAQKAVDAVNAETQKTLQRLETQHADKLAASTAELESKLTKVEKEKEKAIAKLGEAHQAELKKQSTKLETLESVAGQAQLKLDATLK